MAQNRNDRKEDLLGAARKRLEEGGDAAVEQAAGREIRYRGQVVRQGTTAAPGSGLGRKRRATGGAGNDDVREKLRKIKQLFDEGLISRAEAEEKRSEILDRL